jgi:hypothetical protein
MPDVPVLVLSGDLDANAPSSGGRQVARQFPRDNFGEIPNAGHTPTDTRCGLELGLRFVATSAVGANTPDYRHPCRTLSERELGGHDRAGAGSALDPQAPPERRDAVGKTPQP